MVAGKAAGAANHVKMAGTRTSARSRIKSTGQARANVIWTIPPSRPRLGIGRVRL
jgi:hypothetical protein